MIIGIGVDLVEVERIHHAVDRYGDRFVRRIFTPAEAEYCRQSPQPEQRFATRFAAKEAALKALGIGWQKGVQFLDVELTNNPLGAPAISLSGRALDLSREMGVTHIHVSLTHHEDFAVAQVVMEGAETGRS